MAALLDTEKFPLRDPLIYDFKGSRQGLQRSHSTVKAEFMEKRTEPRSDYFARVQVCLQSEGSESCTVPGMIEDRSKSGLAIRVRKPVPVGSTISVFQGKAILRCEIKRCVPSGMDFLLGVRVLAAEMSE